MEGEQAPRVAIWLFQMLLVGPQTSLIHDAVLVFYFYFYFLFVSFCPLHLSLYHKRSLMGPFLCRIPHPTNLYNLLFCELSVFSISHSLSFAMYSTGIRGSKLQALPY
jgi:hypothetical protein